MLEYLKKIKIRQDYLDDIQEFQKKYPVDGQMKTRIPQSPGVYYGKEIWEKAIAALLCGQNILLVGHKATGKNIFAENLAAAFARPRWDISFHVDMDAASLIGTDTFQNGEVQFRPGPIYTCAKVGGFAILDEINMAKSDALAVLHAALDFRRSIEVPGYDRIPIHPAARFIATMNYGYSGTKELNEALVSRFTVIQMPMISLESLERLLKHEFPDIKESFARQFASMYIDLQRKCENQEISTKALDLRGLLDALALIRRGIAVYDALDMGITNKTFDEYEQTLIRDTMQIRLSKKAGTKDIFVR